MAGTVTLRVLRGGHEMPIIELDDFVRTASEEQLGLIDKLRDAAMREESLANDVNAHRESVHSEDDHFVDETLIKLRTDLHNVRAEIRGYMIQAVQLRMVELGLVQRNYEHYVGQPIPTR